jgi:dihydrofolate synthase/folylpolyglutamate synthase
MMTYPETIDYLYAQLPVFHRIGKVAFKANLDNTLAICEHLGNPQNKFKSIHVAGTNGKGSTSHLLAAILQSAGYKTGLYTSPHLKSYTERMKINGQPIPEEKVVQFVADNQSFIEELKPSFFEMTVGLAFDYFANEQVDIAIIEVGLGGRLDSTNIIIPEISIITNISFDHTDILGDTLPKIASEKAGIIKPQIPVVISERQAETDWVFKEKANLENAPIYFAEDFLKIEQSELVDSKLKLNVFDKEQNSSVEIISQLSGNYQLKNILGVLQATVVLNKLGYNIPESAVLIGFENVLNLTNLKGRWQKLAESPLVICDTAHNIGGIQEILLSISTMKFAQLWLILGFVSDKDIDGILSILPKTAKYIFCNSNTPRALDAELLRIRANNFSLEGIVIQDVNEALRFAKENANGDDLIYVGGSTFVVAELNDL